MNKDRLLRMFDLMLISTSALLAIALVYGALLGLIVLYFDNMAG